MKTAIILYLPVIHSGYLEFFSSKKPIDTIFLITEEIVQKVDSQLAGTLKRDLRAVPVDLQYQMLSSLGICKNVCYLIEGTDISFFEEIFVPDDEVTEKVLKYFYPEIKVSTEKVFLRWNWNATQYQEPVILNQVISYEKFDKEFMDKAGELANKSSDWWRTVGVIIIPLYAVNPIKAFNHHLPHEQAPYINGDPRSNFKPGESIEISTAIHAEASAIAYAAKKGINLNGSSIYVTVFPCPVCAHLISESGIKKVYYQKGYSKLGAQEILNAAGIEIFTIGNW